MSLIHARAVVLYYFSGLLITLIVHLFVGWEIRILLPRSIIVILFFILGGLPWFVLNLTNLFSANRRTKNLHELILHTIFLTVMFALIFVTDQSRS